MRFEDALIAMRSGATVQRKGSPWSYAIKDKINGGKRPVEFVGGQQYPVQSFEVFEIFEAEDWEIV